MEEWIHPNKGTKHQDSVFYQPMGMARDLCNAVEMLLALNHFLQKDLFVKSLGIWPIDLKGFLSGGLTIPNRRNVKSSGCGATTEWPYGHFAQL